MQHSFRHAIATADKGHLNLVLVWMAPGFEPDYSQAIKALEEVARRENFTLPDKIFIVNLHILNADREKPSRPIRLSHSQEEKLSVFDFNTQQLQLTTFFYSFLNETGGFVAQPMNVEPRSQRCANGCGNEGDSRTFNRLCHGRLVVAHPPDCAVEASIVKRPHSGQRVNLCHRILTASDNKQGIFEKGLASAIGCCVPTQLKDLSNTGGGMFQGLKRTRILKGHETAEQLVQGYEKAMQDPKARFRLVEAGVQMGSSKGAKMATTMPDLISTCGRNGPVKYDGNVKSAADLFAKGGSASI